MHAPDNIEAFDHRASAHTQPSPCGSHCLVLGFSLLGVLVLSFTATSSPFIQQAPHLQHKLVFPTSSPLPATRPSPVAAPSSLPGASILATGASDAWTGALQHAPGLLLPNYPCKAGPLKQVSPSNCRREPWGRASPCSSTGRCTHCRPCPLCCPKCFLLPVQVLHLLRWLIFYLFLRPVALGDWLWVAWLLAHILNAIASAASLLASLVAKSGAQPDPRVTCSLLAGEHRNDTGATTGTYCSVAGGKVHGDDITTAGSDGPTSTGSQCAGRSKKPQAPAGSAGAATTAADRKELGATPVSISRTLLRAWRRTRGLLLLLASPCTYGVVSLLYLSVWVGVQGTRVDAAQRWRWMLLAERNNGLAAARDPHLVALLGVLSAECLPVGAL